MKKTLALLVLSAVLLTLCALNFALAENIAAGDTVTFGSYPQGEGGRVQPIEWLVLEAEDGQAMLLSRVALDAQPYNTEKGETTWETCSLRSWLNDEFLNTAFTAEEQAAILVTTVKNGDGQCYSEWKGKGCGNTKDRVYLLSYKEARKYLNVRPVENNPKANKNKTSRATASVYAQSRGVYISGNLRQMDGYESSPTNDRTEDGYESCYWWLRSAGTVQSSACRVNLNGSLGSEEVCCLDQGVRPVIRVDLSLLGQSSGSEEIPAPADESAADEPEAAETGTGDAEAAEAETSEAETAETEAAEAETGNIAAGQQVTFGTYPQTADGTDSTPITWQVLEVRDGRALIISRYGLDAQPYNTGSADVTWSTCSLRAWLNDEFLNTAFTPEEQAAIAETEVDNSAAQSPEFSRSAGLDGGETTLDRVFLLSGAEAAAYLNVQYWEKSGAADNIAARIHPTDYAVSRGAGAYNDSTAEKNMAGRWWLRSPGERVYSLAALVDSNGSLTENFVERTECMVVPALWVDLAALGI